MKYRKVQPIKEVSQDVEKRCMGMHIRKAARLLAVFYDDHLRPVDLKGTQFTLLNEIFLNALITIGQLAERLGVDRTTLNRNLNLLERKDLVTSVTGALSSRDSGSTVVFRSCTAHG